MTKLLSPFRACLMLIGLTTLGGCELYFGGHDGDDGYDDRWTYCANDGYYVCEGDSCEWAGPNCPSDPNYTCTSDADCAAGCYCDDNGICEEAGFCNRDDQCPDGYTCDEDRSSCVPEACDADTDCDQGEFCNANGACEASCACTDDAEAQANGWANCDEQRATCNPIPEAGSCQGVSTCNIIEPTCAAGQVALVVDGCYTGDCSDITACDLTPECEKLQAAGDCSARQGACQSVFVGLNCTDTSNGQACNEGSAGCTCTQYQFSDCRTVTSAKSAPFTYIVNGRELPMFSAL